MAATHFAASISRSAPVSVLHELRIGQSYQMSVATLPDGSKKIEYKKVTGLEQTGQRERLWEAGVDVVRNHWLWGLGPAGLTAAMTKALNYPFTSPHNFALELLGAYGLLGGAIYIALILALWSAGITLTHDQRMLLPGGLIIAPILVLLLAEIVEPSLAFGYGVVGFWFWCFAGLLAATARDTASVRAGLQTVQPA
jgi:O-antigen ligase